MAVLKYRDPNTQQWTPLSSTTLDPSILVAASDSPADWKAAAGFICTGTADQTVINTALSAAVPSSIPNDAAQKSLGVARVTLAPGNYKTTGPIAMQGRQSLVGAGGRASVVIQPQAAHSAVGSSTSGVITISDPYGPNNGNAIPYDLTEIKDLSIYGGNLNLNGIYSYFTTGTSTPPKDESNLGGEPDANAILRDLVITNCGRHGIYLGYDTGVVGASSTSWHVDSVRVFACGDSGAYSGFHILAADSWITNCDVGSQGATGTTTSTGFHCGGSDNSYAGCIAWTTKGVGFNVVGAKHRLIGCNSHHSMTHGYVAAGNRNIFDGCLSYNNADDGFRISANTCTFTGCQSFDDGDSFAVTGRPQTNGFNLTNTLGNSAGNVITGCTTFGVGLVPIAGNSVADPTSTIEIVHTGENQNGSVGTRRYIRYANGLYQGSGAGSPEGVVSARVGSTYQRTDGGTGTTFYLKEGGGTAATGWSPVVNPFSVAGSGAASRANNAEGGTHGTIVTTANSGGASGHAWDAVTGTTITYSTTSSLKGSVSYDLGAAASTEASLTWAAVESISLPIHYGRMAINLAALPTGGTGLIVTAKDSDLGSVVYRLGIGTNGAFSFGAGASGFTVNTSVNLVAGTAYRLEWKVDTTLGKVDLRVYTAAGDLLTTASGTFTPTTAVTWITFGRPAGGAGAFTAKFDSIAVGIAGWLGAQPTVEPGTKAVSFSNILLDAGAKLPINEPVGTPTAGQTFWYVAPTGVDTNPGTIASPKKTLKAAVNASVSGDKIILRGGTYLVSDNLGMQINTGINDLTIMAHPGEIPVFDGSIAAPASNSEAPLVSIPYVQMVAIAGDGLTLKDLPAATFTSTTAGAAPTGLAAERGFALVTYHPAVLGPPAIPAYYDYTIPSTQTYATPPADSFYRVLSGHFPDQVWVSKVVGGVEQLVRLKQVIHKSLVKEGFFYVDGRTYANDETANLTTKLYLHGATDGSNMAKVRVSAPGTSNYFLVIKGDRTTVKGIKVFGHSPPNAYQTINIGNSRVDTTIEDVEFDSCTAVNLKLLGNTDGTTFSGSQILSDTRINRVSFLRSGWQGISSQYADDTIISNCLFQQTNEHDEIFQAPKSGGIKTRASHRTTIERCVFINMKGHGIWLDQSNYSCVVASNYFDNISGSPLFWEISHKLVAVNNLIVKRTGGGSTVRISAASGATLVNNTVVGGTNPVGLTADDRGTQYIAGRYASEHTERYNTGGDYDVDLAPHPSSDLDKARPGSYAPVGKTNLTPDMNWLVGSSYLVNNILADPVDYPLLVQGNTTKPAIYVETRDILPPTDSTDSHHVLDGNIYQAVSKVAVIKVEPGHGEAVTATTLAGWRTALGSPYYQARLNDTSVETLSKEGTGWVSADGIPTSKLIPVQNDGRAVSTGDSVIDTTIGKYVPFGNTHYGSYLTPWKYGVPVGTNLITLTAANNPYPANIFRSSNTIYRIVGDGVFTGWKFEHMVEVYGGNVTFTNCHFAGAVTSVASDVALLTVTDAQTGTATATHCTFDPGVPYDGHDGVRGSSFTLDACELTRTVDGIQIYGNRGNVTIKNSWFHDFTFYDNNSHGPPVTGTHNDCIQISSGSGILIENNLFSSAVNTAGILITQPSGAVVGNVTISGNNFALVSPASVNINDSQGTGPVVPLSITGNTFRYDKSRYQMLISGRTLDAPTTTINTNVWDNGSSPPPQPSRGG